MKKLSKEDYNLWLTLTPAEKICFVLIRDHYSILKELDVSNEIKFEVFGKTLGYGTEDIEMH